MKQETEEDMLDFAKEVCQKYSRVKMLVEETQMQWRQDLEMAADSKYPGEKEMYDQQSRFAFFMSVAENHTGTNEQIKPFLRFPVWQKPRTGATVITSKVDLPRLQNRTFQFHSRQ